MEASVESMHRMDRPLAQVLRAFERATGFQICFRALSPDWRQPLLGELPTRFAQHANPFCQRTKRRRDGACRKDCPVLLGKASARDKTLANLEVRRTCHAHASELRLPVLLDGVYVGLLHLGPYRLREDQPSTLSKIEPEREVWLETMLFALRDRLCAMLREVQAGAADPVNPLLIRIERYLEQHLAEGVDRKQVARFLGKSPHWVSRYIHDNTGLTFREIKDACRVAVARRSLLNTDLPVESIAGEVGMEPSYFYRFFRTRTLMTPAEYRKQYRPAPEMV